MKKILAVLCVIICFLCIGVLCVRMNNTLPVRNKQLKVNGKLKISLVLNNNKVVIFYNDDAEKFSDLLKEIKRGKKIALEDVPKCAMAEGIYYIEFITEDKEACLYEMDAENIIYDISNDVFIKVNIINKLRELALLHLLDRHYSAIN